VVNPTTPAALIASIQKDPPDFAPGTNFHYCNTGYFILGEIVARVSGQSLADYLRTTFFEPLGLKNTGFFNNAAPPPGMALGYSVIDGVVAPALDWDMSWAGGAGALYSTVEELYRWNEGIFNGRVLDAASLKAAFTPVKTAENQASYGFGWGLDRHRGLREISHGGGLDGFSSFLLRLPDEKFTVAILANALPGRKSADPGRVAHQLVDIYLVDKLAPLPIANTNVSATSYGTLTGRYELLGKIMTISRHGPHLFEQYADQPEAEMFPESNTKFFFKVVDAQITFVKDNSGNAFKLILHQNGFDTVGPRVQDIAEAKVDPAVYDSLLGNYDYGNGAVLTVTRDGSHLFAQLTGQPKFEIFPKSETEYFWKVADAQVTFVKDAAGKVTQAIHHQGERIFDAPKIQ
ncbi:MAG TPA: serine hydrolase, partial [Verrucomicrobiae bacterium]|nr:serine hydrolase [Verrucomicrobiae bacterium]